MKHFWRKIIFADNPAQGAFFAFWLLILGSYIGTSLFLWCYGAGWLLPVADDHIDIGGLFFPGVWPFKQGIAVLAAILAGLTGRYYYVFWRQMFSVKKTLVILVAAAALLVGFWATAKDEARLPGCVAIVAGLFPVLAAAAARRGGRVMVLSLVSGTLLVLAALAFPFALEMVNDDERIPADNITAPMSFFFIDWLGWRHWHWGWFVALASACLLAGGAGYGKVLAVVVNVPYRSLWGKSLVTLCLLAAGVYLTGWAMVVSAVRNFESERALAAQFFGCDLSVAAMANRYNAVSSPDAAYWDKMTRLARDIELKNDVLNGPQILPSAIAVTPRDGDDFKKSHAVCRSKIAELEDCLQLPAPSFPFRDDLSPVWDVNEGVAGRLLWRVRAAADDRDPAAARRSFTALGNLTDVFSQRYALRSKWILEEYWRYYFTAIAIMLENNWLSERDCDQIGIRLHAWEKRIPEYENYFLYQHCYWINNRLAAMACELPPLTQNPRVPYLGPFEARWFFPAWWYYTLRDSADSLAALRYGGRRSPEFFSTAWARYLAGFFPYQTQMTEGRAALSTMFGLLNVEAFRRQNGYYPDRLTDLPLDPYNGLPLHYGKREYRVVRKIFNVNSAASEEVPLDMTVIQVWSVGRNKIDDNGENYSEDNSCRQGRDDIRAAIRVNGEKKP